MKFFDLELKGLASRTIQYGKTSGQHSGEGCSMLRWRLEVGQTTCDDGHVIVYRIGAGSQTIDNCKERKTIS